MAIVGAGVAGLAAARSLKSRGHEPVVFEKDDYIGGRCLTVRSGEFLFDLGATSVAPRGMALEAAMLRELPADGITRISKPIHTHAALRVSAGDPAKNRVERYTYREGNQMLATLLAEGLDVRLASPVEDLERTNGEFRVRREEFDAIILTPPVPLSVPLLEAVGDKRPLQRVTYRPCLAVALGYSSVAPLIGYHALIEPEQRHPLTWLSIESEKCTGRAPEGGTALVAQLSPYFSREKFDSPDKTIIDATLDSITRLYGEAFETPDVAFVHRWRLSLPESPAMFDSINQKGTKLIVAGDGMLAGRVEFAYETGVRAAALLEEQQ